MKVLRFRHIAALFACIALPAVSAVATPLTVINGSFEDSVSGLITPCGPGCASGPTVPVGWTGTGSVGLFQPGSSSGVFDYVPDGSTILFGNGGSVSQTVGLTVTQNTTYTLWVDWGRRKDQYFEPNTIMALVIDGTQSYLATGIAPDPGQWSTFTASYTGTAADEGKSIGIVLQSGTEGWLGLQSNWDNVRLDATVNEWNGERNFFSGLNETAAVATPEPETYQLLIVGIGGGLAMLRRLRRPLNKRLG